MTPPRGIALAGNDWSVLDGVRPERPPLVSVVVAHYRQPDDLARTLAALRGQVHPADRLEIIVADDGSLQPPEIPPGVRLVRQADDGFRLAAVRNLGAAAATGEVLVFLDADTVPEPEFVAELVRMPALAPDVVTVGRRRHADLEGVAPTADIRSRVSGRELSDPGWLETAYRASHDLRAADDRSYRFIIGAVLACSRVLFDDVGGFDESFCAYGGEDWEWAFRAWRRGAAFAHVPSAVAWHNGPDAAGRSEGPQVPDVLAGKNTEALRLADLIPVAGSRPRGLRSDKVDIAVTPPPGATAGQSFVSVDAVVAALPHAEPASPAEVATGAGRFDRVRLHIEILRPVRVDGPGLAAAVQQMTEGELGELVVVDARATPVIRVRALRAAARHRRWGRTDLFAAVRKPVTGIVTLEAEADVEAYLGGWE